MIARYGFSRRLRRMGNLLSPRCVVIIIFTLLPSSISMSSCHKPPLEDGMEALVTAYGKVRLIEPRMYGGFHAGRYDPDSGAGLVDKSSLDRAQDLILREVGNRSDPAALLARGRLNLAMGRCEDALPLLRKASKLLPASADVQNDLGACLYQTEKYEDALDQFGQALALQPASKEALFNEALCYQKLLLNDAAGVRFEKLLHNKDDGDWAVEVRQRHQLVTRPLSASKAAGNPRSDFDDAISRRDSERAKAVIDANFDVTWGHTLFGCSEDYLTASLANDRPKAADFLSNMELAGAVFIE